MCGIAIVLDAARPTDGTRGLGPLRAAVRGRMSFGLLLIWLLFSPEATKTALSLLVIGAEPIGLGVLRNRRAAPVTRGQWLRQGDEVSAVSAIADRCYGAGGGRGRRRADRHLPDRYGVASQPARTAMTRLGRGHVRGALVILLGADLLWLVMRALIDVRLTGTVVPIDDLDGDRHCAGARASAPCCRRCYATSCSSSCWSSPL